MAEAGLPDPATQRWLIPLIQEARKQGVGTDRFMSLIMKGAFSTAEPDGESVTAIENPNNPLEEALDGMDWLRVGQLLREEVGWDDYPEQPER